jgi:site-specific DNA-methyltransferase (adenine-specific)
MPDLATNILKDGDDLDILHRHLPDAAVDLVYFDPPFNSNRDDNVIFRDESPASQGSRP